MYTQRSSAAWAAFGYKGGVRETEWKGGFSYNPSMFLCSILFFLGNRTQYNQDQDPDFHSVYIKMSIPFDQYI